MAIQDDNTVLKKADLKAYHEAIAPMLGGTFMVSTNNSNYYSTDEKVVGIWINGKPIYQKSFLMTYPEQTVEHNVVDVYLDTGVSIDEVIDVRGTRHSGSEAWTTNIHNSLMAFDTPSAASHLYPYVIDGGIVYVYGNAAPDTTRKNKIRLATSQNLEGQTTYITLQYTKTTDTTTTALTTPGAYDLNRPDLWPENKEIFFGNGLYGYRATGNMPNITTTNIWTPFFEHQTTTTSKIVSYGGNIENKSSSNVTVSTSFMSSRNGYLDSDLIVASSGIISGNVILLQSGPTYTTACKYDIWFTFKKS